MLTIKAHKCMLNGHQGRALLLMKRRSIADGLKHMYCLYQRRKCQQLVTVLSFTLPHLHDHVRMRDWNPWAGERKNRWRNLYWLWWSPSVPSPGQTSSRPCFSARTYRMIYTVTLHICVCNWWNFFLKSAVTLFQCYTVDTFNKIWVNMWMVLLVWNCLSINSLNVPVMFMGHVRPCYS